MNSTETIREDGYVEIQVSIEPQEVVEWTNGDEDYDGPALSLSDDPSAWEKGKTQEKIRLALVRHLELALLDKRAPSPATRPKFVSEDRLAPGEGCTLTISFVTLLPFELSSYEPIEISQPKPRVKETEVEELFNALIENVLPTTSKGAGAKVEEGDTVVISMDSVADGKIYEQLTVSKRYYELGKNFMPKAFDDALMGLSVGEKTTVDILIPKSDKADESKPEDFREVSVTASVLDILHDDASTVGDEWVKSQFPGINSIDDMKRGLRQKIQEEKEERYTQAKFDQIIRTMIKRLEGTIPDVLLETQFEQSLDDWKMQLEEEGKSFEDWLKENNLDRQQCKIMMMMDIRTQNQQIAVLDAVARHEGFQVTQSDRDRYMAEIAKTQGYEYAQEISETMYSAALDEAVLRMMAQEHLCAK